MDSLKLPKPGCPLLLLFPCQMYYNSKFNTLFHTRIMRAAKLSANLQEQAGEIDQTLKAVIDMRGEEATKLYLSSLRKAGKIDLRTYNCLIERIIFKYYDNKTAGSTK